MGNVFRKIVKGKIKNKVKILLIILYQTWGNFIYNIFRRTIKLREMLPREILALKKIVSYLWLFSETETCILLDLNT